MAIAGGTKCGNVDEFLQQTREVLDAGAVGVTYGRFVFQYPHTTALVKSLGEMIHHGLSVKETKELLRELEETERKEESYGSAV